ncbi:MAG: hypothetical protein ABI205_01945 [Gemmatimonadaceae bacterium]
MKKGLVMAAAGLALSASTLLAQANSCPAGGNAATTSGAQANIVRDACLQAVDVFNFMAPQLGLALAGGNATLGQGGTLGGPGHFTIGVRGNVFNGDLPQVNNFPAPRSTQNPGPQVLPSKKQVLGLPTADAAIGIFKGIPLGLTNVGGIDLLLSAAYIPKIGDSTSDVRINPSSSTKFGFGARLGLLQESILVPGVSVTYFRRDLPTTDIIGTSGGASLQVLNTDIKTTAWRVVANKSFIVFGLAAGVGQDKYDESTSVSGSVKDQVVVVNGASVHTGPASFGPIPLSQNMTRTNAFVDLSLNLPLFKVVVEGGSVSGGTLTTPNTNTFTSGAATDSRVYGSLGLRFAW